MIAGILHAGSGLGNQLFRFVGSRIIADRAFDDHGMVAPELFKGKDFMQLPIVPAKVDYKIEPQTGKVLVTDLKGVSVIDSEFQSEIDFENHIDEIRLWLKVEPLSLPENLCVISHRGGEYTLYPDLYLTNKYWDKAIEMMKLIRPDIEFEVQTDDVESAKKQFPNFKIVHDVGYNWRAIRYSRYLIVGNSSFSILPSLINENVKNIIAPLYHAGHNKGYWQEPNNFYRKYDYI